jgi:hypothetical protein
MRRLPLQVTAFGSRIREWLSDWELWRCLAINYFGAVLYLFAASWFWDDPAKDLPGTRIISPILWFYTALPIFVIFGLGNLAWTLTQVIRCLIKRSLVFNPAYLSIPLVWAIALILDYTHHERF